jgi:glycolate oxidase
LSRALEKDLLNKLRDILPEERIAGQREALICHSYDASGQRGLPAVVVYPETPQEIAEILKLANAVRVPVVPRGAGVGFSGGAVPVLGGISLVMTRMSRILKIEPENLQAEVEPGIITFRFQKEVEKLGLFYPPDPASHKFSTLGGNVAECAGGMRAVKYGVTKEYVNGLEFVTPLGEILRCGAKTSKSVVGYDLTRLLVGSEGTLGVITKLTLKLLPKPQAMRTVLAAFSDLRKAAETVSAVIASRILPAAIEIMDRDSIEAVEAFTGKKLFERCNALLVIETDGSVQAAEADMQRVESLLAGAVSCTGIRKARDESEREEIWEIRRSVSPALFRIAPKKLNEDVAVPRSRIPDLMEGIEGLKRKYGLTIVCFGHAGDGNIHVNFMYQPSSDVEKEVHQAVEALFALVLQLEGTLSGEHGIGSVKSPYISLELSPGLLRIMREVKRVFDPNNIMNPGKIFPQVTQVPPDSGG